MGITAIKRVENRSSASVTLLDIENPNVPGHGVSIAPGEGSPVSMFVPWAINAQEFLGNHHVPGKRLELQLDGQTRFWIWQANKADGDYVRFSEDGVWRDPGRRVYGVPTVNGDRTMVVLDGCFELEDYPVELIEALRGSLGTTGYRLCDVQLPDLHPDEIPSVPKMSSVAFSMAGIPSDAYERDEPEARFLYRDSGKRYGFEIRDGVVFATHPDGSTTCLTDAISYDSKRSGESSAAPPFDLIAANGGRLFAKARDLDRFYFTTMDQMFIQAGHDGREFTVPSTYFKLDPEFNQPGASIQDLTAHIAGCFADHPAAERFPLFRLLLEHDLVDFMIVALEPRKWHLLDSRPPIGALNLQILAVELLLRVLAVGGLLPSVLFLDELKKALARLTNEWAQRKEDKKNKGPAEVAPPGDVPVYDHVSYCRDDSTIVLPSVDYEKVLDIGVGHVHWHEQYERVTGGELQPLRTGRLYPQPLPPITYADLYRFANGPIRDGDGYIDGTCTFYALVRLKDGSHALLYIDEQSYFTQRWRLVDPEDHRGAGLALVKGLHDDLAREHPLYNWNPHTYWCPFRAGHIGRKSRLAVSRQVLLVTGADPVANEPAIYSINFSHSTMDRSWRWRKPPSKGNLPLEIGYFENDAAAGEERIPPDTPDSAYLQTIRLREDMTIHIKGTRRRTDGTIDVGRWYQRYLPASNQLVPPADELAPGVRPSPPYLHPWRFLPEPVFKLADRFSHFGVYDTVDSRTQYYVVEPASDADAQALEAGAAGSWVDEDRTLHVHAWKFWWAAPLRIPEVKVDIPNGYAGPPEKRPPSIFNPDTRLRIARRNSTWIATHWDKRDDELMPFDGLPMTIDLANDASRARVTLHPNRWVEDPPIVTTAVFSWTGESDSQATIAFASPQDVPEPVFENVWRVRMAALRDPSGEVMQLLDLTTQGNFNRAQDGFYEYTWTPDAHEREALTDHASSTGALTRRTSIWFEDVVGHVAVPEQVWWPPKSTLTLGEPHYKGAQPFVTTATPLAVEAVEGENSVQSVSYRFYPHGATPPDYATTPGTSQRFFLDGPDGLYNVDTRATGKRGNVEAPSVQPVYLDTTPPTITVTTPTPVEYLHSDTLTLEYTVDDGAGSGVKKVSPLLDGADELAGHGLPSGQTINLLTQLPLGEHTFTVEAIDNLDNESTVSVTFSIIVTPESIKAGLRQFLVAGAIKNQGLANSLLRKMNAAAKHHDAGHCTPASNIYEALIEQLQAQSGKGVDALAATIMIADAQYLIDHCQ